MPRTLSALPHALTIMITLALPQAAPAQVQPAQGHPPQAHPANAGALPGEASQPFTTTRVARFSNPWALAFLPDGRMLVTERTGRLWLADQAGERQAVAGTPEVQARGQLGLHDVAPSPGFAQDGLIYLTYAEPGAGGSGLALASARLNETPNGPQLDDLTVLWRQLPKGSGGHPGAIIAFGPDGMLYLTAGDRQRMTPAQDPAQTVGKILRLTPAGAVPADNPADNPGGNPSGTEVWSLGHRNPYGLAFAPDGRLWSHEMGPRGGDEFNLIEPGRNYGWPEVSHGMHYGGEAIADPGGRDDFQDAALWWTPVIAPAGLAFYEGAMFPDWQGTALIGGLAGEALVQLRPGPGNSAEQIARWDMGARIRDVAVAPDGAVWLLGDGRSGALWRLAR